MFLLTRISNVSYLYCSCSFEKFTSSFAFVKEGRFSLGSAGKTARGQERRSAAQAPGTLPGTDPSLPYSQAAGHSRPGLVPFCSGPCFRSIKIHAAPAAAMPKECRPALSIPRDKGGRGKRTFPFNSVIVPFCPAAVKPEGGGAFGYSPGSPFEKEGKAPEAVEKEKRRRP